MHHSTQVPFVIIRIDECGCDIGPQPIIRDSGVFLDSDVDRRYVGASCSHVLDSVFPAAQHRQDTTTLVTSKLDYGDVVLFGVNGRQAADDVNLDGNVTPQSSSHHAHCPKMEKAVASSTHCQFILQCPRLCRKSCEYCIELVANASFYQTAHKEASMSVVSPDFNEQWNIVDSDSEVLSSIPNENVTT